MGKLAIPQQVRIAKAQLVSDGAAQVAQVPLEPGEDEVAIVLAAKFTHELYGTTIGSGFSAMALSRKSDRAEPAAAYFDIGEGGWKEDSSVFDTSWRRIVHWDTGEAGPYSNPHLIQEDYRVYAYPVMLIRSPSFLVYQNVANWNAAVMLWYMLEKVTDAELAQLMVKDHA